MAGMFLSLQSTRVSIHSIHASQICVGGINETWIKFDLKKKKKKTSLKGALLSPLTPPLFLAYFLLMFLGKHQSVGATGLAGGHGPGGGPEPWWHVSPFGQSVGYSVSTTADGCGWCRNTSVHDTHESQMLENICGWLAYMHWKEGGADTFTLAMSR